MLIIWRCELGLTGFMIDGPIYFCMFHAHTHVTENSQHMHTRRRCLWLWTPARDIQTKAKKCLPTIFGGSGCRITMDWLQLASRLVFPYVLRSMPQEKGKRDSPNLITFKKLRVPTLHVFLHTHSMQLEQRGHYSYSVYCICTIERMVWLLLLLSVAIPHQNEYQTPQSLSHFDCKTQS